MSNYKVWCPLIGESEGDAEVISGFDAAFEAAEYWARAYDAAHNTVLPRSGWRPVVIVKDMASGNYTRWEVSGEMVPSYSAASQR